MKEKYKTTIVSNRQRFLFLFSVWSPSTLSTPHDITWSAHVEVKFCLFGCVQGLMRHISRFSAICAPSTGYKFLPAVATMTPTTATTKQKKSHVHAFNAKNNDSKLFSSPSFSTLLILASVSLWFFVVAVAFLLFSFLTEWKHNFFPRIFHLFPSKE